MTSQQSFVVIDKNGGKLLCATFWEEFSCCVKRQQKVQSAFPSRVMTRGEEKKMGRTGKVGKKKVEKGGRVAE